MLPRIIANRYATPGSMVIGLVDKEQSPCNEFFGNPCLCP